MDKNSSIERIWCKLCFFIFIGFTEGLSKCITRGKMRGKNYCWKSLTVKLETERSYCSMRFYPVGMFGCILVPCITEITFFYTYRDAKSRIHIFTMRLFKIKSISWYFKYRLEIEILIPYCHPHFLFEHFITMLG